MTRVFLAAGVASLAITAPAAAGPHGQHGGNGGQAAFAGRGGGGGGGRSGGFAAPRMERQSFAPRMQRQSFAAPRMERQQRFAAAGRSQRSERFQMRNQSRAMHTSRAETRMAARGQAHTSRLRSGSRIAARQQTHINRSQAMNRRLGSSRVQQAQNLRSQHLRSQTRMATSGQLHANAGHAQSQMAMSKQLGGGRQTGSQNPLAQRQALRADRIGNANAFRTSNFASMIGSSRNRVIAPSDAARFVGQPVSSVRNFVTLGAVPSSISYLYPPTPGYYYQYGGGYLYQIDRSSLLIDALIPLLAGGFLPGTYLPQPFMSSYVPAYYGLNSFYPASFDYGFGYGNVCNRYAYGVVYQVDCFTGMVENVIPMYAGGYGVGQMLPSAYSYYNVPMQYRSLYYPTADYSYWYAPGAIYQYDPRSSLITSVAALMSPGFTVGQPLPVGYSMYNVPLAYRSTYYDTPNAWYRYNNGYIYQVDPSTMVVGSVVASLLS